MMTRIQARGAVRDVRAARANSLRRAAAARDVALALCALALIGFSGWYVWKNWSGTDALPNDPVLKFHCEACSADFAMGARDLDHALRTRGMIAPTVPGSRDLYFKCPKCGVLKGRQVN